MLSPSPTLSVSRHSNEMHNKTHREEKLQLQASMKEATSCVCVCVSTQLPADSVYVQLDVLIKEHYWWTGSYKLRIVPAITRLFIYQELQIWIYNWTSHKITDHLTWITKSCVQSFPPVVSNTSPWPLRSRSSSVTMNPTGWKKADLLTVLSRTRHSRLLWGIREHWESPKTGNIQFQSAAFLHAHTETSTSFIHCKQTRVVLHKKEINVKNNHRDNINKYIYKGRSSKIVINR